MILYFSATGNCKYVAARIASAFGQETVSIVDCIQNGVYSFTDDTIGVVVPTYFWGLPGIVEEFLEKADFLIRTISTSLPPTAPLRERPTPWQTKRFGGRKSMRSTPCGCRTHGRRYLTCPRRRRWPPSPKRRKSRSTRRSARSANAIPTGV